MRWGSSREVVLDTFARPFPAIVTALILVVGMRHFAMGATMMIEDYAKGHNAQDAADRSLMSLAWVIAATGPVRAGPDCAVKDA